MKKRLYCIFLSVVFCLQGIVLAEDNPQDWQINYIGAPKDEKRYAEFVDSKKASGEQSVRVVYDVSTKIDGEYLELKNNLNGKMTSGSYTLSFTNIGSTSKYTEISVGEQHIFNHKSMNEEVLPSGWSRHSVTFDYNEQKNDFIAFRFYRSIKELFIDDVVLTKSGSDENLIVNSGFEESMNAPTEELPYDTTDYKPKNVLCSPGAKMLVINWVNPASDELMDVKLYDTTNKEVLLSDEITTTPKATVNYPIKNLEDEERYYKLVFSYKTKGDFVFYTSGKPQSGLDSYIDTWKIRRIRNTDDSWCPAEAMIDNKVSRSGKASLKLVSNIDTDVSNLAKSTYIGVQFEVSMKAGKKYRVKFYGMSENASAPLLAVTMQGSTWKSRYTTEVFKGTQNEWTEYSFEHESIGEDGIFLVYEGACEGLWLDDFEICEIDETGSVIGENILLNGNFENLIKEDESIPGLKAEPGIGEMKLTWSKIPSECSNVHIYKKTFDNWDLIADIPKTLGALKLSGLEKGKEYSFMVIPELKYGYEGIGAETTATTILPEYEIYDTILTQNGIPVDGINGNGVYTVTTKVKNNLVEDGLLLEHFVAVYNEKQELVLFKSNSQSVKKSLPNSKPVSISETFTLDTGKYTIEVFVLDSRKTLNILRDCKVFEMLSTGIDNSLI